MIQQFTFKKHLMMNILEYADSLFPGIRRSFAVFKDSEEDNFAVYEKKSGTAQLNVIEPDLYTLDFEKERTQNRPFSWISDSELYNTDKKKSLQLEIRDEYNNNILLLRIPAISGAKKDLLFFFLDEGVSLFQLGTEKIALSAREKNMIGQLTYNFVNFQLTIQLQDKNLFALFNESFQNASENLKKSETELKSTRMNYMQSIISFCNYQLQKISDNSNYTFRLSDSAIEKISLYKDKFELLENTITNAASIALNRSFGKEGSIIAIDGSDIVFYSYEAEKNEISIPDSDRYSRTRDILDRYENAAIQVLKSNLPLTGKNLGNHCIPGISPAAITDSIHKHGRKMLSLFEKNPSKWPTIRTGFRPVINLISINNDRRIKIAN